MGALVGELAARHGDVEAVVSGDERLTYRQLDRSSATLARQLLTVGIGKGARIGILLPNGVDWITTFVAAGRIGAVALPLSTLAQPPELRWLLANAGVDLLVCAPTHRGHDYQDRLEEAIPELAAADGARPLHVIGAPRLRRIVVVPGGARPWVSSLPAPDVDEAFLAAVEADVRPGDPLVVIHTSGSTADPKGVVHSHGGVVGHTRRMADDFALPSAGDRFSSPRPWFWVAGLAADLLYALQAGATFVVPGSTEPQSFVPLAVEERIDIIGGPFAWFRELAASDELASHGLTCIPLGIDAAGIAAVDGGTPVAFTSAALERRVPATEAAGFSPSDLPNLFGMTETLGTHSGLPHGTLVPEERRGTSGPPVPGIERRVVDPETGADVASGEEGELLVRGSSVMLGLDRRERAQTFDADGWYATGDVCRLDADGWISFRSRLGDMVKISGANVAPLEVERALTQHPQILESAVVGVPLASGTRLVAVVVTLDGVDVDADEVIGWLRTQLSSYKVPKTIVRLDADEVPRTSSGKVRKAELVSLLVDRI